MDHGGKAKRVKLIVVYLSANCKCLDVDKKRAGPSRTSFIVKLLSIANIKHGRNDIKFVKSKIGGLSFLSSECVSSEVSFFNVVALGTH